MEDSFHTGVVLLFPSDSRARSQSLFRQPVSTWPEVWCAPWKNFNVFDRLSVKMLVSSFGVSSLCLH